MQFVKDASVFRDWKSDTRTDNAQAYSHDIGYWKLNKITDDIVEQQKVSQTIFGHFE